MLYYLIQALEKDVAGLNALRYTTSRTGAAMLTALFLVFMFGPGLISLLKLKQGSIIKAIAGKAVKSIADLQKIIDSTPLADDVNFETADTAAIATAQQ